MKTDNRRIGELAETAAASYLIKLGFSIIERNFQNRFGEIDLIAKVKDTYIFIEVKAKTGTDFGLPEEMIGPGKLARIRHMADVYLQGKTVACRIDVVAIVLDRNEHIVRLTHYPNVY